MINNTTKVNTKLKVVIATGGTGGHIFPALALVEMLKRDRNWYLILADKRFLNFKSQFSEDLNYKIIFSSALTGNCFVKIFGAIKILYGTLQAMIEIFKSKPDILVSFGGYPSFPTMVACCLLKVPILIHEPNSIIGRASKLFLKLAVAISVSFKKTKGLEKINRKKLFYTGTPIRQEVLAARKNKYPALSSKSKIHILILGGSQGAKVFSEIVPEAILLLEPNLRKRLYIHQQCRAENFEDLKIFYKKNKIQAEVKTFFGNIGQEFKKAHLIISRSGALTVSELITTGRPALLVPFVFATDNHQFFNAEELRKNKAAMVILEKQFTPKYLAKILQNILHKPSMLVTFAKNAKEMFKDWNNSFYDLVKNSVQQLKSYGKF